MVARDAQSSAQCGYESVIRGLPAWPQRAVMVDVLTNDALVHEAPAIVGRNSASARAHASAPQT